MFMSVCYKCQCSPVLRWWFKYTCDLGVCIQSYAQLIRLWHCTEGAWTFQSLKCGSQLFVSSVLKPFLLNYSDTPWAGEVGTYFICCSLIAMCIKVPALHSLVIGGDNKSLMLCTSFRSDCSCAYAYVNFVSETLTVTQSWNTPSWNICLTVDRSTNTCNFDCGF